MHRVWNCQLSLGGLIGGLLLVCGDRGSAADWPQWLGPERDSVWRESGILDKFPAEGPPVVWRTSIGAGYSGPVVAGGSNPADPFKPGVIQGGERVICLAEGDGKVLWTRPYECQYTVSYPAGP